MSNRKHLKDGDPRGEIEKPAGYEHKEAEVELPGSLNAEQNEEDDGFEVVKQFDFETIYVKEGEPDTYHHRIEHPRTLEETELTVAHNDPYLMGVKPTPFFGASIQNLAAIKEDWEMVSGFRKEDHEFEDFVELRQPRHGHTEGGKGLTFYMRPIVYEHGGMSAINCVNVSYGCWDLTDDHNTVMTKEGPVPISTIITNGLEQDMAADPVQILLPNAEWAVVSHFFFNGYKDIYRVQDEDGEVYHCTDDHPFMTEVDGKVTEMAIGEIYAAGLPILKDGWNDDVC